MNIRDSFREQAVGCEALGSPFTSRLLCLMADRMEPGSPVHDKILGWAGDASYRTDVVGLRIAGALHALVLSQKDQELAKVYPPNSTDSDTLWQAVQAAFATHESHLLKWLDQPPQTNEVRRCAALIPAFLTLSEHFGQPLALMELGASGGLNMNWDRFSLDLNGTVYGNSSSEVRLAPDWTGPLPPNIQPKIQSRSACDINPLNPAKDQLKLLSYIWADQTERLQRTKAALEIATQAGTHVEASDALPWLREQLADRPEGVLRVIYHTVAWQYFPKQLQQDCSAVIEAAGAQSTETTPLAWLRMEEDGQSPGAGLSLRLWPENQSANSTVNLGRADFHGRWIEWNGLSG